MKMPKNARFWRNVALIGAAHAILITGLVRWSSESKKPDAQNIVWMNGDVGGGSGTAAADLPIPKPAKISIPPPPTEPEPENQTEEERPLLTSVKSDIQLPAATPASSPKSSPKPALTPRAKVTPKPAVKSKPRSTPKPSPRKMIVAKASPRPKPTAEEAKEEEKEDVALPEKKKVAMDALEKNSQADSLPKPSKAIAPEPGSGKETSIGGHAGGSGGQSQFGWYGSMLHDRFYSEWMQPTTVASSGEKYSVLLKLRIEKDGRVSSFEIVKPSGNATVDESVAAVAKRVTQVDPLPAGLGNGDHYNVKINFELNPEE
jgi:TonB family protein